MVLQEIELKTSSSNAYSIKNWVTVAVFMWKPSPTYYGNITMWNKLNKPNQVYSKQPCNDIYNMNQKPFLEVDQLERKTKKQNIYEPAFLK